MKRDDTSVDVNVSTSREECALIGGASGRDSPLVRNICTRDDEIERKRHKERHRNNQRERSVGRKWFGNAPNRAHKRVWVCFA